MLVRGLNDGIEEIAGIACFLQEIDPFMSYISIPTRPPSERWVEPADEKTLSIAFALFGERSVRAELLTGYEGNAFAFTGDVQSDLLSITSVHPMREDAVRAYLRKADADWEQVKTIWRWGIWSKRCSLMYSPNSKVRFCEQEGKISRYSLTRGQLYDKTASGSPQKVFYHVQRRTCPFLAHKTNAR